MGDTACGSGRQRGRRWSQEVDRPGQARPGHVRLARNPNSLENQRCPRAYPTAPPASGRWGDGTEREMSSQCFVQMLGRWRN